MKTSIVLVVGIVIGMTMSHGSGLVLDHFGKQQDFAGLHTNFLGTESSSSENLSSHSNATALMQTDTPLCDQPYFRELYSITNDYFSEPSSVNQADEFAEIVFNHARSSGYFSPNEADAWIEHIIDIPGQLVEIHDEDPAVFDSCYSFQVAAVGPNA